MIQTQERDIGVDEMSGRQRRIAITEYNGLGQTVCSSSPFVMPNAWGWVVESCTNKNPTLQEYDAYGRGIKTTLPDGSISEVVHLVTTHVQANARDYLLTAQKMINPNGNATTHFQNQRGELVMVREYSGQGFHYSDHVAYADTRYEYDELGNLVQVRRNNASDSNPAIEPGMPPTTMSYDNFGRKIGMNDPDMGIWSYSYDPFGNLVDQRANQEARLCFFYDDLDRLIRKTTTGGNCPGNLADAPSSGSGWLASYVYDTATNGLGQLASVTWQGANQTDSESFTYNELGLPTSHTREIDGRSYTMQTTYEDILNRPESITYPDNDVVTVKYDSEGANELWINGTPQTLGDLLISGVTYNERGQMAVLDRTDADVGDTTYNYFDAASTGNNGNSNFRLQEIDHGLAAVSSYTYSYDKAGNILSLTEQAAAGTQTQTFTYDFLNRLRTASAPAVGSLPSYSEDYQYDILGNISSRNGQNYLYNGTSPHAVTAIGSDIYGYDSNGNMISRKDGIDTYDQIFDVENRLVDVVKNGAEITTFYYDPSGQRTMTVDAQGVSTYYPFPNYEETVTHEGSTPEPYASSFEDGEWQVGYGNENLWALNVAGGTSAPHTGSKSFGLSNLPYGYITSDPMPVTAGQSYNFSFYARGAVDLSTSFGNNASGRIGLP